MYVTWSLKPTKLACDKRKGAASSSSLTWRQPELRFI